MASSTPYKRIKTAAHAHNPQLPSPMPTPATLPSQRRPESINTMFNPRAAPPSTAPMKPTPNSDTQELYNAMRDAELEHEAEAAQVPGQGLMQPNDRLRLPSPQSAPMSRSTSHASSTSLSYNMREVGLQDAGVKVEKKRKAGRQGPLEEHIKARAAFFRKITACPECKQRKVKCNHYDLSLFEKAYWEEKRRRQENAYQFCNFFSTNLPTNTNAFGPVFTAPPPSHTMPTPRPSNSNMTLVTSNTNIRRMPTAAGGNTNGFTGLVRHPTDLDLLGVGGDVARHLDVPMNQASADLEKLLAQASSQPIPLPISPISPVVTATTAPMPATTPTRPRPRERSDYAPQPHSHQQRTYALSSPTNSSSVVSIPAAPDNAGLDLEVAGHAAPALGSVVSNDIPIGRLLTSAHHNIWECQGSLPSSDGRTHSIVSLSSAGGATEACCRRRFNSIGELVRHFRSAHSDFRPLEPPFLYKCVGCGFLNGEPDSDTCMFCNKALRRETWYYGCLASSVAGHPPEQPVHVGGGAEGDARAPPSAAFPFTFSLGNSGSGNAGGGGGTGFLRAFQFRQGRSRSHGGREEYLKDNADRCHQRWDGDRPLKSCSRRRYSSSSPFFKILAMSVARRLLLPSLLALSLSAVAVLDSLPLAAAFFSSTAYSDPSTSASPPRRSLPLSAVCCVAIGAALVSWQFRHASFRLVPGRRWGDGAVDDGIDVDVAAHRLRDAGAMAWRPVHL